MWPLDAAGEEEHSEPVVLEMPEPVSTALGRVGLRRGTGVATGPFPQTALRTGRAPSKASGSPRPHGAGLARGRCHRLKICAPR